jgi:hypothetical protein
MHSGNLATLLRAAAWWVVVALVVAAAWAATGASADLPSGGLAPSPRAAGATVEWAPVGVESSYEVAISNAPRESGERSTSYVTVARAAGEAQSYTPQLQPGQTAYVGVSADGGHVWSTNEAVVSVPEVEASAEPGGAEAAEAEGGEAEALNAEASEPITSLRRETAGLIIGTNDGAGWGPAAAGVIRAGHVGWDRVEIGSWPLAVSDSRADGFKVLAIANAVPDGTPLSQVDPGKWGAGVAAELASHPGISLAEAGNESYLKGGVANPVHYGRMYLAAIAAMRAEGIHVPLLFNMTGDYPHGSWGNPQGWSQDSGGGGWLRDAVRGNPGLAGAILANGVSIHPYGALGDNVHDDYGVRAAAADEAVARAVLGAIPPFYITEFGYDLRRCGTGIGACSQAEQASKLRAAYAAFMADPHVAGIWWYQSHDDSTGAFGFMDSSGSVRPSFNALSAIAAAAEG